MLGVHLLVTSVSALTKGFARKLFVPSLCAPQIDKDEENGGFNFIFCNSCLMSMCNPLGHDRPAFLSLRTVYIP